VPTQNARVLVVEDEQGVRSVLELALKGEGYVVHTESDGVRIQEVADRFRPDLAILDLRFPLGPDGYEIARTLRRSGDLPLVFLTSADELDARLAGFEAGADDYLIKPFSMAEMLARVHALLRRSGRLSSAVAQVGELTIDQGARAVLVGGHRVDLTRIEYELLSSLAKRPGQVVSRARLLAQVWGFDDYDSNKVDVHMSALRRKLEAHGPRLVHTVRGVGYVLRV
jgi:two-component system OmpR family response regulator